MERPILPRSSTSQPSMGFDDNALQHSLRRHISGLDGLRGLAILAVIWHNSVSNSNWHPTTLIGRLLDVSANMGWLGVQLFFVLSGFLITGILLDEKNTTHRFRNFYARRALRIFPLYYVTLACLLIIFPAIHSAFDGKHTEISHQIWYWLYLANWTIPVIGGPGIVSHFWSLSVEEQFYLFWPFAVMLLKRKSLLQLCVALIVSAIVFRWYLFQYGIEFAQWRAYEFTVARWDGLAIGAVLAIGMREPKWVGVIRKAMLPVIGLSTGYVLLVVALTHGYAAVPEEAGLVINQTVAAVLFGMIIFSVVVTSSDSHRWWSRVVWSYPLRIAGKYSYAMYVFHYPIIVWLSHELNQHLHELQQPTTTLHVVGQACVVTLLSFVLTLISWHVLERPCLRFKKYFYDKSESIKMKEAASL